MSELNLQQMSKALSLSEIKDDFVKELVDAKAGLTTSLPFILNQLPLSPLVQDNQVFQVLTIGGSVCRKALIKKVGNQLEAIGKEEKFQPNFTNIDSFLEFILAELSPDVEVLAINLAQALDPVWENGKLDGVLINGSKESQFDGLVGKKVGLEIERYIKEKTDRTVKVSVANDTLCLLLSGLTLDSWDKLVGGIVGTGLNFAFFLEQDKAVNLEAAEFNKFPLSQEAQIIDQESSNPGKHVLEKEVAGGYLFQHFNLIAKQQNLEIDPLTSTQQLDELIENDGELGQIAQTVVTSSAQKIAAVVAAIAEFKNQDITVIMEGSLFWKGKGYKEIVEQEVKSLVPQFQVEFKHVEDSTVMGGAKLVA